MRGTPVVLKQFAGLDVADDPTSLPLAVASDLANVEPNGSGGLHRREAMIHAGNNAGVEQLFPGILSDVYAHCATTWEVVNGAVIQSGMTPTTVAGALGPKTTAGTALAFYMTDQVNTPKFYDGAATANWVATTGAIPRANQLIFAGGRMIAADILGDPIRRVRASAPGDPYSWGTATGQGWAVDLDMFDSGAVTGLVAVGPYVLVFTQTAIHVIYDIDTGANRVLSRAMGARGAGRFERYVTSDGQRAFFATLDGLYHTDGASITEFGQPLAGQMLLGTGYLSWFDRFVLFGGLGPAGSGVLYVFDQRSGQWWKHTSSSQFRAHIRNVGQDWINLVVAGTNEVLAWTPHHNYDYTPQFSQDGTVSPRDFQAFWTSRIDDFGRPAVGKRIRSIEVAGAVAAGSLSVGATRDATTVAARSVGLTSSRSVKKVPTWGVGKLWTVTISDANGSRWNIDEIEIDWQPRKG